MLVKLNKEEYRNKVHGCWIGKNIGGTLGGPFEGNPNMQNITDFTTEKGEPLPNDDLDLQLVWLTAMQQVGPKVLTANVLAEYWLSLIAPLWNEYGIGKSNLEMGLLPPLSGHYKNIWQHSNGAWIRSEIWACLAPGCPNIAAKYAIMDAQIDHGYGEGTYAEIFTATMQSMAFFENNVRKLIEKALTYIPADCRVAKCVNTVLECYDKGVDWAEVRQKIVADTADLGWFQAPANLGFVVLGLIYGEGDFKKSMLYAVNCGDDTDCTAATVGATLGIIMGKDKIPQDWQEYIGDRIMTNCINASYAGLIPKDCTTLTHRVMGTMPDVMKAYDVLVLYTEGENEVEPNKLENVLAGIPQKVMNRSALSFEIGNIHTDAVVEYEKDPEVCPGEDFKVKVTFTCKKAGPYHMEIDVNLPEGWSADYRKTCYMQNRTLSKLKDGTETWEMTIHVGENVNFINRIPVTVTARGHANPIMIPLVLLG